MIRPRSFATALFAFILGAACLPMPAFAQTIHLITVADTRDANIGSGTAGNTTQIVEFVTKAAGEMKVTVSRQDVSGSAFSCQRIKEALDQVKPGSNDVVIFYYSGHGFRSEGSTSKFPELFCGQEAFSGGAPRLVDIASQLADKKPRLMLVVADSCNVLFTQPVPPLPAAAIAAVPVSRLKQYQNLFLRHKGTLTMSGSIKDQFSWYLPSTGLFTQQFVRALDAATQPNKEGLWSEVVQAAVVEIKVPYGTTTLPQNPESDNQVERMP
jgi:caspase domain-containing protein